MNPTVLTIKICAVVVVFFGSLLVLACAVQFARAGYYIVRDYYRHRSLARKLKKALERGGFQVVEIEIRDRPLSDRLKAKEIKDPYMQEVSEEIDAMIRGQM